MKKIAILQPQIPQMRQLYYFFFGLHIGDFERNLDLKTNHYWT